jgi:hypothetical protein
LFLRFLQADEMPGRHKGSGGGVVEAKLTRQQASLAGRVLKAMWNPDNGAPSDEEKARIHHEINAAFNQAGHTAVYSARKLGDAISNRMYTWRLAQRKELPQSWAAGARANRRKRNLEEANNTRAEKDTEKKDNEEGMVTPRGTASLIDGCACDAEMFGLPVVTDDFACTVEVHALPTDLEVSTEIPTVSTTIDDSWNVFATLDSMDLLPSPPTSPMQSPTPMEEAGASMCGTDMTYNVASDCACSAAAPLDDLDLLLERAQVDINLDGIELCDLDCVSVEQPVDEPQSVAIPGRTEEPVRHNRPTSQFNESTVGFENEFDNSGLARAFMTDKLKGSRTSSSEPQRKVQKMAPHGAWRAPVDKEEGKANQTLVDASTFDAALFQPQRRVLGALNPQHAPPGSAPAA